MFNEILMGPSCHEPCVTASDQNHPLQTRGYRELTCYATQIVLFCRGATVCDSMYVNFFGFGGYCIECLLRRYDRNWSRIPRADLSLKLEYSPDTGMDETGPG